MLSNLSLPKVATLTATFTAILLATIKLIFWIISGSVGLISSALDSLMDFFVSVFNTIAVHLAEKSPSDIFNYGLGKVEALAAFIEWVVISLSWLFVIYQWIKKAITNEPIFHIEIWIWIMIFSFVVTLLLVIFLSWIAKKTNNLVVKSDTLHYKTDLLTNWAILISLVIVFFTNFYWVDAILGIIIWIYIIKEASELIKEGVLMLLDVSLPEEIVTKIKNIFDKYIKEGKIVGYHCLKTRNAWKFYQVDVHIQFYPYISLTQAHEIWEKIVNEIKQIDPSHRWFIVPHFDPENDAQEC